MSLKIRLEMLGGNDQSKDNIFCLRISNLGIMEYFAYVVDGLLGPIVIEVDQDRADGL